ncbi:MAG: serine hydrolase domain-containing protein [Gemmatimonadaceae bacterium]
MNLPPSQIIDHRAIDSAVVRFADTGFSGSVLVATDGKVRFSRNYGRSSRVNGVTDSYWIGSVTKSFTSAAILRLRAERRLSLADSIGHFFSDAPYEKTGITIRQLLTHTSGIDGNYAGTGIASRGAAVQAILARPMSSPPGSHYRYMDDDYELLAAIVEIASGTSWESFVRREFMAKVRLRHTSFWPGSDWSHKGANGMASTPEDLLRWTLALHKERILSRQDARDLMSGQIYVRTERGEDVYYGFGVRVYEAGGQTLEVMHSGSSDDNNNVIARVLADGTTVIVMSSAGDHSGTTWSSYVARNLPVHFRRVH